MHYDMFSQQMWCFLHQLDCGKQSISVTNTRHKMNCVYSMTVFLTRSCVAMWINDNRTGTFYTRLKFDYAEKQSICANNTKTAEVKNKTQHKMNCVYSITLFFLCIRFMLLWELMSRKQINSAPSASSVSDK